MSDALKALEDARAKRKAKIAEAREAQYLLDLAALNALEEEHGDGNVVALDVSSYVEGFPTFAVIKSPGGTKFYERYKGEVRVAGKNAQAIGAAQERLGRSCLVYPKDEVEQKAMAAQFPGLEISAGVRAVKFVELEAADEKKG